MSLEDYFNDVLEKAIYCGVSVFDFWNMTIGEIVAVSNVYKQKSEDELKLKLYTNYNIASMTASFITACFNGNQIPPIEKVFPDWYSEQKQVKTNNNQYALLTELMTDFANEHNKRSKQ